MVLAKQNQLTYMHFTVFGADGITPLTGQAGSCTSSLRKNGATTAEVVAIAEIGSTGRYYASFTPLVVAEYDLEITCPDDRVVGDSFEVYTNNLDDIATDIATVEGKVDTVDGVVDTILVDTADMQPKVDQINTRVDQSLSTTESNIRGSDGDDLKDISDQIDPVALEANVEGHVTNSLNSYDPPTKAELDAAEAAIIAEVDVNEGKIDAVQLDVTDILADTNEMQGKLPTNNIMGSSVKSDKDDEIDDILADTADMQPKVDTINTRVDQSLSTTESNIRGSDGDDLKDISDQLDVAQADLDNPNQYKADVSALAIEANVEGHVTTALNTYDPPTRAEATSDKNEILADIATVDGKVDIIDAIVDAIKLKTDALPGDPASQAVVDEILDILENRLDIDELNSKLVLYDDAGTTPIKEWPLTDKEGGAIDLQGTGPANRGKRTV